MAASIGLPYPPYLRRVMRRSAGMWLFLRCAYAVVMVGAASVRLLSLPEALDAALHPYASTRAALVALAAFFVWWGRKRAHEMTLPANLGADPGWFWGGSLLSASVLDVVVQVLLDVF